MSFDIIYKKQFYSVDFYSQFLLLNLIISCQEVQKKLLLLTDSELYTFSAEINSELFKSIKIQEVLFCFLTERKPP